MTMTKREQARADRGDLDSQARAWIARLRSGAATERDLARLAQWRAASPEAEAAFLQARALWSALGPALSAEAESRIVAWPPRGVSRRGIVAAGGAIAAGAIGMVYLERRAPARGADETVVATAKGERRRLAVGPGAVADLNTASRIRVWSRDGGGLELVSGEALVTLAPGSSRFVAILGPARVMASAAQFLLRRDRLSASVTCLSGLVRVAHEGRVLEVPAKAVLQISGARAEMVREAAQPDDLAWRSGQLVYEDRPLAEVVAELNRYRPGRIVVRDAGLARRRVSGVVQLDRIDGALTNFARSLDAPITRLPGDVVILG